MLAADLIRRYHDALSRDFTPKDAICDVPPKGSKVPNRASIRIVFEPVECPRPCIHGHLSAPPLTGHDPITTVYDPVSKLSCIVHRFPKYIW
jgi:hypothetical protein